VGQHSTWQHSAAQINSRTQKSTQHTTQGKEKVSQPGKPALIQAIYNLLKANELSAQGLFNSAGTMQSER